MFTNFPFRQRCTCDTINPVFHNQKEIHWAPSTMVPDWVVAVQLNSELQIVDNNSIKLLVSLSTIISNRRLDNRNDLHPHDSGCKIWLLHLSRSCIAIVKATSVRCWHSEARSIALSIGELLADFKINTLGVYSSSLDPNCLFSPHRPSL